MAPRVSSVSLVVAGVLLLLAACAHALAGWPALHAELAKTTAPRDLVEGLAVGWYFGSATMAGFGAIALAAGFGSIAEGGRVFLASLIVGVAFGGFGLAVYAIYREAHFLAFIAIGLLTVAGSVRAIGRRRA